MLTQKLLTQKWPGNIDRPLLLCDEVSNEEDTMRSRGFLMTVWSDEGLNALMGTKPQYLVYAPEECPTTGKKHYQCYAYYASARQLKTLRNKLKGHYVASADGSATENRAYCMGPYNKNGKQKPTNPDAVEIGVLPAQGKRNDLHRLMQSVREGKRGRQLTEEHAESIAKYPRFEERLIQEDDYEKAWQQYESNIPPEIHVRWGEPGIGKDRYVYETYGRNVFKAMMTKTGQIWFDNYQGQDVLLISEFRGQISWTEFLDLIDRYPIQLPVKRGHRWRVASKIYITSNHPPDQWFTEETCRGALNRRFTSVTEVTAENWQGAQTAHAIRDSATLRPDGSAGEDPNNLVGV